jgi:hypothetical protein
VLLGLVFVLFSATLDGLGAALFFAVGASITAAGVAGWTVFAYVLVSETTARRLEVLTKFGIVNAFQGRAVLIKEEYDLRLRGASRNIDVIGFGLTSLREDYRDQFPLWKQRARVRILLLDPEFPDAAFTYASQRDIEEEDVAPTIAEQVKRFVHEARQILEADRFQIRLYTCLPSVNIFRVDDELFWGPYLIRERSRNAPTFLVEKGGVLFDRLEQHFTKIWTDPSLSRAVPDDWLKDP